MKSMVVLFILVVLKASESCLRGDGSSYCFRGKYPYYFGETWPLSCLKGKGKRSAAHRWVHKLTHRYIYYRGHYIEFIRTAAPTAPHCDDVLSDCDTANKTIGVCNTFEAARQTCAEFCGLCGIVDGAWSGWSLWASCSTTCDHGTTTRTRTCSNPPPQNGGKSCTGNNTDSKHCMPRLCPVHGVWATWAQWAVCSSTCGQGITQRTRVCDNPRPQLWGNFCFGDSTEYGMCLIKPFPVDGGWTEWSFWSSCCATFGNGHVIRQRSCLNPAPANGGLTCVGLRTEQHTCNMVSCPVNGGWSSWTSWSSCSSSLVRGLSQRQRSCTNPSPSSFGRGCIGDCTDKRPCPGVKSAFTVTNPLAGPTNGTIRFTNVIINIGGHYNTSTGKFICQYSGLYDFALHILKSVSSDIAYCSINKNHYVTVRAYTDPDRSSDSGYYMSSTSVVLHLVRGDVVNLEDCTPISSFNPYVETSFSGFLLKAD